MANVRFDILDTANPFQVAAYERALYRVFNGPDRDVQERIRVFDRKTRRARPIVPYESQEIYAGWLENTVVASVSLNCNMVGVLQLEMLGFTIDKALPNVCEGLGLFSLQAFDGDKVLARELGNYARGHIQRRQIRTLFATCSEKRLRGYEILGYRPVETRRFDSGVLYLIRQDFY